MIGAGVTGLAAGWARARAGNDVLVLDGAAVPGGVVNDEAFATGRIETGPQSLRPASAAVASLLEAVGLRDQLVEATPASARRFLYLGGRLVGLPWGLFDPRAMPLLGWLRALMEPLVPSAAEPDASVADFATRRIGAVATEHLLDAVVGGVFAGDLARLEVGSAFPKMVTFEQQYGSLVAGAVRAPGTAPPAWAPRRPFTFVSGMKALPHALMDACGGRVRLNTEVRGLVSRGAGWAVTTDAGAFEARDVVIAAPGPAVANLHPDLAALAEIPSAPVASVHLGWPAGATPERSGFGWLAPSISRRDVLGAIWVSSCFPHAIPGWRVVRVMIGGQRDPGRVKDDDSTLIRHATGVVRDVEGVCVSPEAAAVHRRSIPQYELGHRARLARVERALPGVRFIGWGYRGIGVAACLESGAALP